MLAPVAPTLTEKTTPTPGVEVYFPTLDSDAVTIIVWRLAGDGREPVQGADREAVSGDFVVTDWHVPFGVDVTYVGEIFDIGGASISGAQSTIVVDRDEVWFQDQLDAERSVRIRLTDDAEEWLLRGAGSELVRKRKSARQFVFGRRSPFLQNFGLGGLEGVQLDSYTESEDDMNAMLDLMESSPIVVRTPPIFASLPRVLFADVPTPTARPVAQSQGGYRHLWLLRADEVEPTSRAVIRPLVTWADWEAAFPTADYTWDDVELIYSAGTWTDAVRNPPNA